MTMRRRSSTAMVGLALVAFGCAPARDDTPVASSPRDSAGVAIVENTAPERTDSPLFDVDTVPALDLGRAGGDRRQEFGGVTGAFRLSDGGVVVADRMNSVIRVFDSTGAWQRDLGRRGSGPGEFVDLMGLFLLPGDTLATWDLTHRRITRFASGGTLAGTVTFARGDGESSAPNVVGILSDGRLVIQSWRFTTPRPGSIVQRDLIPVRIYSDAAVPLDSILSLPETEVLIQGTGNDVYQSHRPFGKVLQLRVAGDRLVVGTGDTYEIREYDPSGRLRRIVRQHHEAARVSETDIAAVKAARREARRAERHPLPEEPDDAVVFPERKPHFGDLLIADDGRLWVREYDQPATHQPSRWEVFAREGRWLGHVILPPRFRPTHIGAAFVLGVRPDDYDVPHVQLLRLRAPAQ